MNLRIFLLLQTILACESELIREFSEDDPRFFSYESCSLVLKSESFKRSRSSSSKKTDPQQELFVDDILSLRNVPGGMSEDSLARRSHVPTRPVLFWPHGIVPFQLESGFTADEKKRLACAFLFFHERTCIRFRKRKPSDVNFLRISRTHPENSCFSEEIGMRGGLQLMNLAMDRPECWRHGAIVHELMHVLGFFHEHQRDDRDNFVTILLRAVPTMFQNQFKKVKDLNFDYRTVGRYEYKSVMHYAPKVNDVPVLRAKQFPFAKFNKQMGNREAPTEMDTRKIRQLYMCEARHPEVEAVIRERQSTFAPAIKLETTTLETTTTARTTTTRARRRLERRRLRKPKTLQPEPTKETCEWKDIILRETLNIWSPNYPRRYDDNLCLVWQMRTRHLYRITVLIEDLRTERHQDTLTIYDGPLTWKKRRAKLSGNLEQLRSFTSTWNWMTLEFISDDSLTNRGFNLTVFTRNDMKRMRLRSRKH